MRRIAILTGFLTRDLFRSLAGVVPVAAALAFGTIAFEYGMDQAQFTVVGGVGTAVICWLTTLLLASRANRAWCCPYIVRLRHRAELLVALLATSLGITAVLSILITVANLLAGRLSLEFPSALWLVPSWLAVWLLAGAVSLPLANLTSYRGSNVPGYVLLVVVLVAHERRAALEGLGLPQVTHAVGAIVWPVSTLLSSISAGTLNLRTMLALGATLAMASLLFGLAAVLFSRKDLLWTV